jgi:hypothetical protein
MAFLLAPSAIFCSAVYTEAQIRIYLGNVLIQAGTKGSLTQIYSYVILICTIQAEIQAYGMQQAEAHPFFARDMVAFVVNTTA